MCQLARSNGNLAHGHTSKRASQEQVRLIGIDLCGPGPAPMSVEEAFCYDALLLEFGSIPSATAPGSVHRGGRHGCDG